jgi:hypothetical protein
LESNFTGFTLGSFSTGHAGVTFDTTNTLLARGTDISKIAEFPFIAFIAGLTNVTGTAGAFRS